MSQRAIITVLIVILLLAGLSYFIFSNRSEPQPVIEEPTEEEVERQIKTEIEKILSQGTLPNPSLEMPENIKILSVDVDENKVTFDFSKEIVSNGREAFEAVLSLAFNAAHPFIQGTGADPKYPELNFVVLVEGSEDFENMFDDDPKVVVPPAPGPFVADAVRNLRPVSLKVGENTITAEVRGFMFFEAETNLRLYDGNTEVNIGKRPDGLPNNVVTAQGEWMTTGYVPVSQKITIPASLKGKTLVIRFIANDASGLGNPRYWGTWIKVE